MNNCNWTAGPWVFDETESRTITIKSSGTLICTVIQPVEEYTDGDCNYIYRPCRDSDEKANAHLIAAAPELYGALELMIDEVSWHDIPTDVLDFAHQSLSKARGKQNENE